MNPLAWLRSLKNRPPRDWRDGEPKCDPDPNDHEVKAAIERGIASVTGENPLYVAPTGRHTKPLAEEGR